MKHHHIDLLVSLFLAFGLANCRPEKSPVAQNPGGTMSGGSTATGGNTEAGGNTAAGGNTEPGGNTAAGGNTITGGSTAAGGNTITGGDTAAGGNTEPSTTSSQGCGALGFPCCSSDPACMDSGAKCLNGICGKCGGLGESCCPGNSCTAGCCLDGMCAANPSGGDCPSPPADAGGRPDAPPAGCASATATPCTGLPAFTGSQNVDGNDDDFCNVPSFELTFDNAASSGGKVKVYNGSGTSYPERAQARVAWDAAGIHAFIHVIDPKFVPATALDTIYNADGVELLFTTTTSGLSGGTSQDSGLAMHVIVSPPFAARSKANGTNGTQEALPADQFSASAENAGYKVELQLPWPGTPPTAGSQIKFDMELNSADGNSTPGDAGPRDAQAILYLGADPGGSPCGGEIFPYCDDRLWCSTTLQQ
jgi:hypothetical protein